MHQMYGRIKSKINILRGIDHRISGLAIWNYIRYKMHRKTAWLEPKVHVPCFLTIMTSRRCNLSCSFCVASKFMQDCHDWREFELTSEILTKILNSYIGRRALVIGFSGGEPLLNQELPALIKMARDHGHLTSITSNGVLLNKQYSMNDLKKAGINRMVISVYDSTQSDLENLLPSINSVKRVFINKLLTRDLMEKNPDRVWDLIRMTINTGCAGIAFQHLITENDDDQVIYDDNQEYHRFVETTKRLFPRFPIIFRYPVPSKKVKDRRLCALLWSSVFLDAKGNLGPCCAIFPDISGRFGNYFGDGAEYNLNHELLVKMRDPMVNHDKTLHPICMRCENLGDPWMNNR